MARACVKQHIPGRKPSKLAAAVLNVLRQLTVYNSLLRPVSGRLMFWASGIRSKLVNDSNKDESSEKQIEKLQEYHELAKVD